MDNEKFVMIGRDVWGVIVATLRDGGGPGKVTGYICAGASGEMKKKTDQALIDGLVADDGLPAILARVLNCVVILPNEPDDTPGEGGQSDRYEM